MLIVSYKDVSYSEAALSETCLVKQIPSSGQSPEAQSARPSEMCVQRARRQNSSGWPDKPPARASALQSRFPKPPRPASACVIAPQAAALWTCQLPRPVFLLQRTGMGFPAGLAPRGRGAAASALSSSRPAQVFSCPSVHELTWLGQPLRFSGSVTFDSFATPWTVVRPAPLCRVPTYRASFQDLNPTPAALGRVFCPEKRPTQGDLVAGCAWDSPMPSVVLQWEADGPAPGGRLLEIHFPVDQTRDGNSRTTKGGGQALPDHTSLIPEVRRPPGPHVRRKAPWRPKGAHVKGCSTQTPLR